METITIDSILLKETSEAINLLKQGRNQDLPEIDKFKKQWETSKHDVFDPAKRLDKEILKDGKLDRTEPVNRIGIPMQKKIVGTSTTFMFGNEVKLNANPKNAKEKLVLQAVSRILFDNKINSFNRKIGKELMRSTEVAETWFPVKSDKHDDYGFPCEFRLRCDIFSPWNGTVLYPYFNEYGDLIAFSRTFFVKNGNEKVECFETYTPDKKISYKPTTGENPIAIKKIPVIYACQDLTEWADVQTSIDRLEKLISNFGDTNDYHASPKIFVKGKIIGFAKKGESGGIIEGEKDTDAKYLSWENAPESVRLEIETLLRFIYGFTQTPDVSFDSVKGLQAISGEALKMLFMDAHLKVLDKREIMDEYLQRRINLIKAYVGNFNLSLKEAASSLEIQPEIVPFMINDEKNQIEKLLLANGNKPLISQQTAIGFSNLVTNPEDEYKLIQEEQKTLMTASIFNPSV